MRQTPLRKSRAVSTLILAGAAVALAGCDGGTEEAKLYSSAEACKTEMAAAQCEQEWKAAQEEHQRTAPKFADKAQCEQEFGAERCQQVEQKHADGSSGGSFFMPFMMGYMMSNMLGGSARPIYVDQQGYARSGGATVTRFPDAAAATPGSTWRTTAAVDRTVLRNPAAPAGLIAPGQRSYGGFGSTGSRAMMSGGS